MPPTRVAGYTPEAFPLLIARLDIVTVLPGVMRNTRLAKLPLIPRLLRPGPRMVTLFEITSSPLVSMIAAGVATEKLIVSPLATLANAARSVPAPLLAVLVTVL